MSTTSVSNSSQNLQTFGAQLLEMKMQIDVVSGSNESYVTKQKVESLTIRFFKEGAFSHLSNANHNASLVCRLVSTEKDLQIIYSGGKDEQGTKIGNQLKEILTTWVENQRDTLTEENFSKKAYELLSEELPKQHFVTASKNS